MLNSKQRTPNKNPHFLGGNLGRLNHLTANPFFSSSSEESFPIFLPDFRFLDFTVRGPVMCISLRLPYGSIFCECKLEWAVEMAGAGTMEG
jgi:hypothetical protein